MIGVCLVVFFAISFGGISAEENNSTFSEWFTNSTEDNVPSLPLVHFEKKSYYIESVLQGNYFQAQQFCTYHGMKLVSISSKAENDFLEKQIRELGLHDRHFWTSATNLPGGNHWIWMSTGRPLIYTNWHPGEPNNAKNSKEDCVEMRIFERGLSWNDLSCASHLYFACEISWPRGCFKLIQEMLRTKTESPLEVSVVFHDYPTSVLSHKIHQPARNKRKARTEHPVIE